MITKLAKIIDEDVLEKSLMTDEYAKMIGTPYEELPSVTALKGDALLDFILYDNSKTFFPNKKSKEELNNLRSKYCGNPNLAFVMKDVELDQCVKSIKSVTDLDLATAFEALVYNLYNKKSLNDVEEFLSIIDFYSSFDRYTRVKRIEYYYEDEIKTAIIKLVNSNISNTKSSVDYYRDCFKIFEDMINTLCSHNSYFTDGDFAEKIEFISSLYGVDNVDGKNIKRFVNAYRYKILRLNDTIINIEELNKNELRILFEDNNYEISIEHIEKYKNIYFIDYLKQLIADEVKYE